MSNKVTNIAVVCTFSFPEGLAATTRIISYLKGLVKNSITTKVYIYRPTELINWPKSIYGSEGNFEGINYQYPKTRVYSKYKLARVVKKYYYYYLTCKNIYKDHKKRKIDYLLISNDFIDILFVFIIFSKIIGLKTIFITDEYPMPIRVHLKDHIPKWKELIYKFILSYTNAMIFMTESLNDFYNKDLQKPAHILPTITDTSRFNINIENSERERKYLCYMGNMELAKDNIDNIIYAFHKIASKYLDIDLYLYGAPSQKDKLKIETIINNCNLSNRVFVKGRVQNTEVPKILKMAYILVSSQPNTKRAEGGFPTKLGEYMACGIPVILTEVGEINKFVKDGEHVFLVPPENPTAYANKLEYILDNYEYSLTIAQKAKEMVNNYFDNEIISRKLLDFLHSLNRE